MQSRGMRWDEGEIRALAADTHALVDRANAHESGASDAVIKKRLAEGTWRAVYPGVYDLNVTRQVWSARVHAGVLAAGPHALASHRTAGVLWDLDGIRGKMVEITVPFSKEPIPEGVVVHRTRRHLPRAVSDGVPVTGIERTLLDLAAILPPTVLEKATMSAIHQHLTDPDQLAVRLSIYGGRGVKGTRRMRRTLALVDDGVTGSPSEVDLVGRLRDAPIPMPRFQLEITFPEGDHAYPDLAWPDRMKCVEVDSMLAHSSPEDLERDLIRQNRLLELGWEIRRFTARRIRRDPIGVINEIIRFIGN